MSRRKLVLRTIVIGSVVVAFAMAGTWYSTIANRFQLLKTIVILQENISWFEIFTKTTHWSSLGAPSLASIGGGRSPAWNGLAAATRRSMTAG